MAEAVKTSSSGCKTECHWLGCKDPGPFPSVDELVGHVHSRHLNQFSEADFVVCLWEGCKVFNRPFEKKDWLPQHMRRHTNERPHKCFMNGCNMSFWSVHALQSHLQLHFKPNSSKQKKTVSKNPNQSHTHPPHSSVFSSASEDCTKLLDHVDDVADGTTACEFRRKRRSMALKVRIPLNSNVKLSTFESSSQIPIPINGSIVHDDDIDLRTLSIIKKSLLNHLLTVPPQCRDAVDVKRNSICLKGKIIGRRKTVEKQEYLISWNPMIVPSSWVPVSDYTGHRTIAISDLKHCQRSALIQHRFLTSEGRNSWCGSTRRKRK